MGFTCGIVGMPNVGKSTLFNALTKAGIDAENFPFCTIEPNTGMVAVPDPRLDAISAIVSPQKVVPSTMEFVDIAGLVEGASPGGILLVHDLHKSTIDAMPSALDQLIAKGYKFVTVTELLAMDQSTD